MHALARTGVEYRGCAADDFSRRRWLVWVRPDAACCAPLSTVFSLESGLRAGQEGVALLFGWLPRCTQTGGGAVGRRFLGAKELSFSQQHRRGQRQQRQQSLICCAPPLMDTALCAHYLMCVAPSHLTSIGFVLDWSVGDALPFFDAGCHLSGHVVVLLVMSWQLEHQA